MLKKSLGILAILALTACGSLLPTAEQTQAVRIEGTPGMAVIYLVRTRPDLSYVTAPVVVGDNMVGATYEGTYLRLELPAGRHKITGYASDSGSLTVNVERDRIYFIRQTVAASYRSLSPESMFEVIDEARARAAMVGASRAG
jgi:hypothetical protein